MADPNADFSGTNADNPFLTSLQSDSAYQDTDKFLAMLSKYEREWGRGRENHVIAAHRNILYLRGHQWIIYNRVLGRFAPRDLQPGTPRPVTNRFSSCIGAYMSVLARVEPVLQFRPSTDDAEDRAAADVASKVMPVIEDEINVRLLRQHLAAWAALTSGAWLEFGYDSDPTYGTTFLQHNQCQSCGHVQAAASLTCEACGSDALTPAVDEQGQPQGEEQPVGKMFGEVVPIFEMFFDPSIADWTKQSRYFRKKSLSVDEAGRRWPQVKDKLEPDMGATLSELYEANLPTLGPNLGDQRRNTYTSPFGTMAQPQQRVSETWYWQLPDADYPQGVLAIRLGKTQLVKFGPLPYTTTGQNGQTQYILPHVHFPEQIVPGTAWSKTPADDLALLQEKRNQIESIILMILMRMGNPVWFLPEGSNITGFTGFPGEIVRWNALGPNPAKPERVPGQGVPSGFMAYLGQIDHDMEDMASTYEVLKGDRPAGVSAGIALQQLQERAMSRFGSQFILWEQAWARCAHILIQIFRQFVTEARLLKIQGKDGGWEIQKFMGADISGQIDVVAEAGSGMPRSTLVDRAEMQDLVQQGAINPQDPEINYKILQVYRRTDLTPSMKADTKNAVMEDESFGMIAQDPMKAQMIAQVLGQAQVMAQQQAQGGPPQPMPYNQLVQMLAQAGVNVPRVRDAVDDHMVHSREHGETLKGQDSQMWPGPVQVLLEAHKQYHDQLLQEAQMRQMQMQRPQPYMSNPGGQGGTTNQAAASMPQNMAGQQQEMEQSAQGQ